MGRFMLVFVMLTSLSATSVAASDPYPGSGGRFLGTPSDKDIRSGRAIFAPEECSTFSVGRSTKTEVVNKLGPPAGWSTERNGLSQLEYDYIEPAGALGLQRIIAIFFKFDADQSLFEIKCPGFDRAMAPKAGPGSFTYQCDAPVPKMPANQTAPLALNHWFSKDRQNVYLRETLNNPFIRSLPSFLNAQVPMTRRIRIEKTIKHAY